MERFRKFVCVAALGLFTAAPALHAADPKPADPPKTAQPAQPKPAQPKPKESATEPKPREGNWIKRHEGFLAEVKQKAGNVDLLFIGDSITDGWRGAGKQAWASNWEPLKAFNIGIGGDRTQHVIWRLQNGEVAGIKPKAAVMMIGTNNLGGNTNEEIVAGIKGCVAELQKQCPGTKLLLLGIFPRGEKADHPNRQRIKDINSEIAKLDDGGKTVKYLDIGQTFLDKDNNLPKEIMPDFLHLSPKGYEMEVQAIKPAVEALMK